MCGICGVIGIESRDNAEIIVRRMMTAMVHRGPDDEGILFSSPVALGMRRLSIIDVAGGAQPVFNEKQNLGLVFNGEIYNFRELRRELETLGHQFHTRSDTEVVVHAWEAWAERSIERLRGMFAFAIVELPQGPGGRAARVFLARDKLGIKPLYYSLVDGKLLFASEVRALLASGHIPARLNAQAIPSYLLFGAACEPLTLIDGVVSLPPGHLLTIECGAGVQFVKPAAYWGLHSGAGAPAENNYACNSDTSPARRVRTLLEESVASHLVADFPVGVFLSSGLDSTALAALASSIQGGIHTFTVAFTNSEFSEAEQARRTASRLGTEHSELTLSDREMVERLDEAVAAFDQPSADGINTYFVSWAARQAGLKVALSGLGSDEIFGGYTSFRAASAFTRASAIARAFPRQLRTFAASGLESTSAFSSSPDRLRKFASIIRDPWAFPDPYFFTRLLFTPQSFDSQLHSRTSFPGETSPWWQWFAESANETRSMDGFTRVSWLELRSYLLNTLLRDTDAMSMRNSLEVRVPFLDSPLVEYVLSLPESSKRVLGRPKALLIDALGDLLPPEIVAQRKRTFTFPWEEWLRGALGKRVAAGLADWSPTLESHISREFPARVWRDFLNGRTTWSRPWSLYVLNEWVKRNISEDQSSASDYREPAAVA